MALYRKKPVVIEAIQFDGKNFNQIANFVGKNFIRHHTGVTFIGTLEGNMAVSDNDYVIKGVKGEFYPCKPDIFEQTYESVDSKE